MSFSTAPALVTDDVVKQIKQDRRFLELALEEAGLLLNRPTNISSDACCCPFHPDASPSGSLHFYSGLNGDGTWLFTCHACPDRGGEWNKLNPQKPTNTGDAIAVLQVAAQRAGSGLSFPEVCERLLALNKQRNASTTSPLFIPATPASPSPEEVNAAQEAATTAHDDLVATPAILEALWTQRAVDLATAKQFQVGFMQDGCRQWWSFPIADDAGRFMAVKLHATNEQRPKGQWRPKNAKLGEPLYPVSIDGPGPVWLCPGELKALSVVALGLPAVGLTSGETTTTLPSNAIELLHNRQVAIVADNDDTGRRWGEAVCRQLIAAGADVRIVDLGFTADGQDIGDWIVERRVGQNIDKDAVAAELARAFEKSIAPSFVPTTPDVVSSPTTPAVVCCSTTPQQTPLQPASFSQASPIVRSLGDIWRAKSTWKPVRRIPTGLRQLDTALFGGFTVGGVHVLAGKPGNCKTQLAVQMALNAAMRGVPVGLITLEMAAPDIGRLLMAQRSGISRSLLDRGLGRLVDKQDQRALAEIVRQGSTIPLDIVDGAEADAGFTRATLETVVAEGVGQRGWELVVLDHLGELAPLANDPAGQPLQVDRANVAVLRALARKYNLAIAVVAPLRKAGNFKTASQNPISLDDLLGSAAIGYAVDTCVFVQAKFDKSRADSSIGLTVLKNRRGPQGQNLEVTWWPGCGQILDAPGPVP